MPATTTEITNETAAVAVSASVDKNAPLKVTLKAELISHLNLLQVARGHNARRLVSRVLQHLPEIRRKLTSNSLIDLATLVSGTKSKA